MQRMHNLDKWSHLTEGKALAFVNPRPRKVRIEVNAPSKTSLYLIDHLGEEHFVALVEGRDTIEFGSSGPFELTVAGGDVMIYTADGDDISSTVVAPVIFTKIANRRPRNPELEAIVQAMHFNMERRLAQQAKELETRFGKSREARPSQPASASVPPARKAAPASDVAANASDSPAPKAPEGSGNDNDAKHPAAAK